MCDVIVVGGGPVGLVVACQRNYAGAGHVVVRRLPEIEQRNEAHGLSPSALICPDRYDAWSRDEPGRLTDAHRAWFGTPPSTRTPTSGLVVNLTSQPSPIRESR